MLQRVDVDATENQRRCFSSEGNGAATGRHGRLLQTLLASATSGLRHGCKPCLHLLLAECHGRPLLRTPNDTATIGRGRCYDWPVALLWRTEGRRRCYNPPPVLLRMAVGAAMDGRGRCYGVRTAGGAATILRRRCYGRPAALLQSAVGVATDGRRRCYQQHVNHRQHCCKPYAAVTRCYKRRASWWWSQFTTELRRSICRA